MRRASEKKPKRQMATKKKIILVATLGVLVLFGVFGALALTHERINYTEAHENIAEIASTKSAVEKMFTAEIKSLDYSDEEKAIVDEFEKALEKCKNYITSLEASNVLKNEAVAEKFANVKAKYASIEKIGDIWNDAKLLKDLTDDNLATLKKSKSEFLQVLAEELSEYRAEVANFKRKYSEDAKKDSAVIEAYGRMQLIGDNLNKKYEKVKLDDVLGMSSDDILGFYATIEELNNLLSEK